MEQLSEFFKRKEFSCRCGCGFSAVDSELLDTLVYIRHKLGRPVIITSGCRCQKHNHNVGGASNSFHMKGMAVDFQVSGYTPKEVQKWLVDQIDTKQINPISIGYGKTFTHIDVRPNPVRFNY